MAGFGPTGDIITADIPQAGGGAGAPQPTASYPDIPDVATPTVVVPAAVRAISTQRWLVRTAQFDQLGLCQVLDFRIGVKRGIGTTSVAPTIMLRVRRDNRRWSKWIKRSLGLSGERFSTIYFGALGTAHVWQFEFQCTDDCDIELRDVEAYVERLN